VAVTGAAGYKLFACRYRREALGRSPQCRNAGDISMFHDNSIRDMFDLNRKRPCTVRIIALLLAAGFVGGCAISDDRAASLLVAPGDYDTYSCPQLAITANSLRARRKELEGLMAKASTGSGGRFMSAIGYRPDYLKVRGELHEIEATAREKHCDLSAVPKAASRTGAPPALVTPSPRLVQPR
jgi:hypothetical protein